MEQTALAFTLQQGVAVAVCVAVALAFGLAIVKLFRVSKEEREAAAAAAVVERDRTRKDFTEALEKHGAHLDTLGTKLGEQSIVLERVADRLVLMGQQSVKGRAA